MSLKKDRMYSLLILNLAVHILSLLLGFDYVWLDYVLISSIVLIPVTAMLLNHLLNEMCFIPH